MNTRQEISEITGFDNGELFDSEQEVRDYFTSSNMREMFPEWEGEYPVQEVLSEMSDAVIRNHWHWKGKKS